MKIKCSRPKIASLVIGDKLLCVHSQCEMYTVGVCYTVLDKTPGGNIFLSDDEGNDDHSWDIDVFNPGYTTANFVKLTVK